jgi:hypothetical protein
MTVIARSEATKQSSVLTLTLTLQLTENEGFSPEFIYERARLRALSSKYEFDFNNFNNFNSLTFLKDNRYNYAPYFIPHILVPHPILRNDARPLLFERHIYRYVPSQAARA